MKIKYEIIEFDEALQAYVVNYAFKNEMFLINVEPIVDEDNNKLDVAATFFKIEQQIRAAHKTKKQRPINYDRLVGRSRRMDQELITPEI